MKKSNCCQDMEFLLKEAYYITHRVSKMRLARCVYEERKKNFLKKCEELFGTLQEEYDG